MSIKKIITLFVSLTAATALHARISTATKDADFFYRRGLVQYGNEMFDYSLASMMRAFDKNPKLYDAANHIARIYVHKKDHHRAIQYYERSLEILETQPEIHLELALSYEYFYNLEQAFDHMKRSVTIKNDLAPAHMALVRYYARKGRIDLAREHHEKSMSLLAGKSKPLLIDAEKLVESDPEKAEELYKKTIKINPAHTSAFYGLAQLYRSEKKYEEAVKILLDLTELVPYEKKAFIHLGHIYFTRPMPGKRINMINNSIKYFKKAHALDPSDPEICRQLADIYRVIKNDIESEKWYRMANELEK